MELDLAARQARAFPERPAVCFHDRWYSYAELNLRADRLASRLAAAGVQRGDRVAVLALNHLVHFDLLLAAPKLGFVYAPLNHRLADDEIARQLQCLRPAYAFADTAPRLALFGCAATALADYEAWLAQPAAALPAAPALGRDDIWMSLQTGGSTGEPKQALLPYRQVLGNAQATAAAWQLRDDDCVIQATPCFHAAVNVLCTPLLLLGARVVLMAQFDAQDYLALLQRHRVSLLFAVPTMLRLLLDAPGWPQADLASLRWAISGGAPCAPDIAARLQQRGLLLRQGFGMTEAGVNCFQLSDDEARRRPDAVGRPMPGMLAQLRRADGSRCAAGEIGELHLAGDMICAGYWDREAQWREVFRDGWLATGDLAACDEEGLYRICGRRKDMYISGGENVYPVEVEAQLSQCDGVAECVVLGVPHARWGETGLAVVSLRPGLPHDAEALRRQLRARLAAYKLPGHFLFVDGLPKLASGKIARLELLRRWQQLEVRVCSPHRPSGALGDRVHQ